MPDFFADLPTIFLRLPQELLSLLSKLICFLAIQRRFTGKLRQYYVMDDSGSLRKRPGLSNDFV